MSNEGAPGAGVGMTEGGLPGDMLDKDRLFAMEDLFRQDFADSLRRFLGNASLYSGEMDAALARGDWQIVRDNAHKLKSSAAMFGLPAIAGLCIKAEAQALAADRGDIADLCRDLGRRIGEAEALFAPYFATPGRSLKAWLATLEKPA